MKTQFFSHLKTLLNKIQQLNQVIHYYFSSGSFGVRFYPLLMHPCIRKSYKNFLRFIAVISSFIGVFFIFAEFVVILFSERAITAYFHHSILELLLPIGTIVDQYESKLSTMPLVMQGLFEIQSICFVFIYLFGIWFISQKKFHWAGLFTALCFSIGTALIAQSQGGKYSEYGLTNLGASITFLFGNLTLIFTRLDLIQNEKLTFFKHYSLWAGLIGLVAISLTLIMPTIFNPMLERVGIYTIMIWEILAGFALFKRINK